MQLLRRFKESLSSGSTTCVTEPITAAPIGFKPFGTPPREGLAAPIQIAHCTQMIPAPHYSHPDSELLTIGSHILENDYILPEIRFKGNAYGFHFSVQPI